MSTLKLPLKVVDGSIFDADGWSIGFGPNRHAVREEIVRRVNAHDELLSVAKRWLRVMGNVGADDCACRPKEAYVCCRCEVVAAIAKAEGRS